MSLGLEPQWTCIVPVLCRHVLYMHLLNGEIVDVSVHHELRLPGCLAMDCGRPQSLPLQPGPGDLAESTRDQCALLERRPPGGK